MQLIELDEQTKSNRKKWVWSELNDARAKDVLSIFDDMADYWPLTDRQAYYRLISSNLIAQQHWYKFNDPEKGPLSDIYQTLTRLLKWMRIDDRLPWDAIIDEHRMLSHKAGYEDPQEFVDEELRYFLNGYRRCLAHRQEYYIEVWIEKAALYHIVKPVVDKYCRRLLCCRGYNSITFQADFFNRATDALTHGQRPVVLYFGDYDPSGVDMLHAAAQTLIDELGLVDTQFYRCGINPEHFPALQANPVPIKKSDSRSKKFVEQYGGTAYELDAFHPEDLKRIVEESIQSFTDMDAVHEDLADEKHDREMLRDIREKVHEMIIDNIG